MRAMEALVRRSTALAAPMARSYAEANMLAEVRVSRPTNPVFDPATGDLGPGQDEELWNGKARISSIAGAAGYSLGDESTFYSSTTISIPLAATTPRIDDMVEVLAHPDLMLVGRFFRVTDVEAGGQMPVVHRMTVSGIAPSKEWLP